MYMWVAYGSFVYFLLGLFLGNCSSCYEWEFLKDWLFIDCQPVGKSPGSFCVLILCLVLLLDANRLNHQLDRQDFLSNYGFIHASLLVFTRGFHFLTQSGPRAPGRRWQRRQDRGHQPSLSSLTRSSSNTPPSECGRFWKRLTVALLLSRFFFFYNLAKKSFLIVWTHASFSSIWW